MIHFSVMILLLIVFLVGIVACKIYLTREFRAILLENLSFLVANYLISLRQSSLKKNVADTDYVLKFDCF